MIDFPTISQCLIAVASSWLGTAELPGDDVSRQVESWQRTGGIFSRIDEPDLAWDSLFVNAIAHDCSAERIHDGWTTTGAAYGDEAPQWLEPQWFPNSPAVEWPALAPGDVVVWRVAPGDNPGSFRVGVYAAPWGAGSLVVAGDIADSVRLTSVSRLNFTGARRLGFFTGYPE